MKIKDFVQCPYCGVNHHSFYVDKDGYAEIECDRTEEDIKNGHTSCGKTFKVKVISYELKVYPFEQTWRGY